MVSFFSFVIFKWFLCFLCVKMVKYGIEDKSGVFFKFVLCVKLICISELYGKICCGLIVIIC